MNDDALSLWRKASMFHRNVHLQFNDSIDVDHGLFLYDYPEFDGAQKSYDTTTVSGMRGQLVGKTLSVSNLTISVTLGVLGNVHNLLVDLRHWLKGTGYVSFSDNPDLCYKALKIDINGITREVLTYSTVDVEFTCLPYAYAQSGMEEIQLSELLFNQYDEAHPLWIVEGTGAFTFKNNVNDAELTGQVNGSLTIDTDRMLCYTGEGVNASNAISGDYANFYLNSGELSFSSTGTPTIKCVPRWGYEL